MIDKIHDMVLSDRRIKVREIVESTGISQGTMFSILHDSDAISALFRRNPDESIHNCGRNMVTPLLEVCKKI